VTYLPSNTTARSAPSDLRSVWRGSYVCGQGPTALQLSLNRTCGRGEAEQPRVTCSIAGTFEFGPLAENPAVPHRSYRVTGTMVENARGELAFVIAPREWIERPDGYVMVGLQATTDATRHQMDGRIDDNACGAVTLTRVQ
jgi:hypothetical protein